MLPQTIAILSSDRKKSRNFCQIIDACWSAISLQLGSHFLWLKRVPRLGGVVASQGSVSASSPSAAASVPSSAASSSSGKYLWCLALVVGAMNSCSALLCCAVRVSSLQKWVLLCSLPRVSDWRKDKLIMSTTVSRLASAFHQIMKWIILMLSLSILIMDHLPTKSMESVKC